MSISFLAEINSASFPCFLFRKVDYKGAQKYKCPECGGYGTLETKGHYTQGEKDFVIRVYQERASMRGINVSGHPAIVMPVGWVDGLPVSIRFVVAMGREDLLLDIAEVWKRHWN